MYKGVQHSLCSAATAPRTPENIGRHLDSSVWALASLALPPLLLPLVNPLSGSLTLTPPTAHAVNCFRWLCCLHEVLWVFEAFRFVSTGISLLYTEFHSLRNSKIRVQFQMFPKFLMNSSLYAGHKMPSPWEALCVIRHTGKTPRTAGLQAAQRRLPLAQQSLTHRHAGDPHWKAWLGIIAETVPETLPPPPLCICKASAKPKLNSRCCREESA